MDHVARLIETYEKEGIDGLMALPSVLDDMQKAKAELDELPAGKKDEIQKILKEMLKGTDEKINVFQAEIRKEVEAFRNSQDNADACIAYLNSAQQGDKK